MTKRIQLLFLSVYLERECMHGYAQLLHMHTVSVCESNFLCSFVCLAGNYFCAK